MGGALRKSAGVVGLAVAFGPGLYPAHAQQFNVDLDASRRVRFISTTTVNRFDGVTDRIDGYVLLAGPTLRVGMPVEGSELYFEVDLASLDTGVGLRNRHMRENYLEVDKYPFTTYTGVLTGVEAGEGGAFRVTSKGKLSIHGVEREVTIPCDVSPASSEYRVMCSFQVLLSDYNIEIPKVMFLKLANEIGLELEFSVGPAGDRQ